MSQIKVGALLSYATLVFNVVAGLLYTPWMISVIGPSNYGLYTLALSVISLFLLDFGLGSAVERYLAKFYAEKDLEAADKFLGTAYKVYLFITLVLACFFAILYFFIGDIYTGLNDNELDIFKQLYLIVALYSIFSFPFISLNGILMANEKFIQIKLCNFLEKVTTVLLIVLILLIQGSVFVLVFVNAFASVVFTLVKLALVRRYTNAHPRFRDSYTIRQSGILGFSLGITVIEVSQRFIFMITPSVLAIFLNSFEVAVFGLAASLESYVWSAANALNGMFLPEVSRYVASSNFKDALNALIVKVGRIQLLIVGGIIAMFAVWGSSFVLLWVGSDYNALFLCTLLIILPGIVEHTQQVGKSAIHALNKVRLQAIVYVIMACVNVVLMIVLVQSWGIYGASASICVAYIVRTLGLNIIYKRSVGVKISSFFRNVYPKWLISTGLCMGLSEILLYVLTPSSWWIFFLDVLISLALYIVLAWIIYMDDGEKKLIAEMTPFKLKDRN